MAWQFVSIPIAIFSTVLVVTLNGETKAKSNFKKHGITFEEAKSVFFDEFALQFYDGSNSQLEEDRFLMLGMSNDSNVLLVCHCEREDENIIRIISARKTTNSEKKHYEDGSA